MFVFGGCSFEKHFGRLDRGDRPTLCCLGHKLIHGSDWSHGERWKATPPKMKGTSLCCLCVFFFVVGGQGQIRRFFRTRRWSLPVPREFGYKTCWCLFSMFFSGGGDWISRLDFGMHFFRETNNTQFYPRVHQKTYTSPKLVGIITLMIYRIPPHPRWKFPGSAFGNFLLRIFWQLRFKVGGCRQVKNHKLHLHCAAVRLGWEAAKIE